MIFLWNVPRLAVMFSLAIYFFCGKISVVVFVGILGCHIFISSKILVCSESHHRHSCGYKTFTFGCVYPSSNSPCSRMSFQHPENKVLTASLLSTWCDCTDNGGSTIYGVFAFHSIDRRSTSKVALTAITFDADVEDKEPLLLLSSTHSEDTVLPQTLTLTASNTSVTATKHNSARVEDRLLQLGNLSRQRLTEKKNLTLVQQQLQSDASCSFTPALSRRSRAIVARSSTLKAPVEHSLMKWVCSSFEWHARFYSVFLTEYIILLCISGGSTW